MERNRLILLVEDNQDDELLTLRAFKKSAILNTVMVVRDGAEALDSLFNASAFSVNEPHRLPEVVLLDLKLPKVDGLEVLRRIRATERTKLLPVVVLTSSKEERDVVESYRLGANSYIRKPVDYNQFVNAANHLGLYWLALNVPPNREAQ